MKSSAQKLPSSSNLYWLYSLFTIPLAFKSSSDGRKLSRLDEEDI